MSSYNQHHIPNHNNSNTYTTNTSHNNFNSNNNNSNSYILETHFVNKYQNQFLQDKIKYSEKENIVEIVKEYNNEKLKEKEHYNQINKDISRFNSEQTYKNMLTKKKDMDILKEPGYNFTKILDYKRVHGYNTLIERNNQNIVRNFKKHSDFINKEESFPYMENGRINNGSNNNGTSNNVNSNSNIINSYNNNTRHRKIYPAKDSSITHSRKSMEMEIRNEQDKEKQQRQGRKVAYRSFLDKQIEGNINMLNKNYRVSVDVLHNNTNDLHRNYIKKGYSNNVLNNSSNNILGDNSSSSNRNTPKNNNDSYSNINTYTDNNRLNNNINSINTNTNVNRKTYNRTKSQITNPISNPNNNNQNNPNNNSNKPNNNSLSSSTTSNSTTTNPADTQMIHKMKSKVAAKGTQSMIELYKLLVETDKAHTNTIEYQEFRNILNIYYSVFFFKDECNGFIEYSIYQSRIYYRYFFNLVGNLNYYRQIIIQNLFSRLDTDHDQKLDINKKIKCVINQKASKIASLKFKGLPYETWKQIFL